MSQKKSIVFVTKAENDINKSKRQIRDRINSLTFSRQSDFRRRYLKEEPISFIQYTVIRFRYFTARTSFMELEKGICVCVCVFIYIYIYLHSPSSERSIRRENLEKQNQAILLLK